MKHTMITFRLHRSALAMIVFGSIFVALLLFAAGYLAGGRGGRLAVPRPRPVTKPALASLVPKAATPSAAASSAASPAASLALRVAMFVTEADARTLVQELAVRKIEGAVVPVPTSSATLYTVQVGRYTSRDQAAAAGAKLLREQGLSGVIVPAGPDALAAPATQ